MRDKWKSYLRDIASFILPAAVAFGMLIAFVYAWNYYHGLSNMFRTLSIKGLALWFTSGVGYSLSKNEYPWYTDLITFVLFLTVSWICAELLEEYLHQTI